MINSSFTPNFSTILKGGQQLIVLQRQVPSFVDRKRSADVYLDLCANMAASKLFLI